MRLIDADELVVWLKKAGRVLKWCENTKTERELLGKIIDHIENQPTAYDIDKVVRQLWKTSDCYRKSIGFCDDTNCFECRHCHLTLKQAIEIVKGGAV